MLSSGELDAFRLRLSRRRSELQGDISALLRDALSVQRLQPSPTHLAESGSESDLQGTSLVIADEDRHTLRLIDRALAKLDGHGPLPFGICEYSGEPIARDRLEVMPWTPVSIEGATYLEEHRLSLEDLLTPAAASEST